METKKSVFETLNAINCNEHTEKKNGLTYLSWAWAWQMVKKNYPEATYKVYEDQAGVPYFSDGQTCWVKTGVTIEGIEHIEYLPIMDFRNNSIPVGNVSSMDMNKAIQRSLTKCCARHGLGLYIYAGEDLPDTCEESEAAKPAPAPKARKTATKASAAKPATDVFVPLTTEDYYKVVNAYARGMRTKSGGDYRETYKQLTHAGEEQMAIFDNDVANARDAIMNS